jgi:ribosome-associated heat shock protein Hsp15
MSDEKLRLRIDKYLWAIRLYKTRSQATDALNEGKVKMNGEPLKASHMVKAGERYSVNTREKKWVIEVVDILDRRMKASAVAPYFKDLTPPEELQRIKLKSAFYSFSGKRFNKSGRPTKKDRRDLDDWIDD